MTSNPSLQPTPKHSRAGWLRCVMFLMSILGSGALPRDATCVRRAELVEPVSNPIAFNSFLPREVESWRLVCCLR